MKLSKLYIGCSSYATASWQPLFYPEKLSKKDWFEYYCRYFNTYEFNGSFYRFPTVGSLEKWYEKTPIGFKFSIKVPKTITHIKKMNDSDQDIKDFYKVVADGLKDKLAGILWQFPPGFSYSEDRLELLMEKLDTGFKNVIEFRHESWWRINVIQQLAAKNIVFCNPSYPGLPHEMVKNTSVGYFRFHGIPKLFYSEYPSVELKIFYDELILKGYEEAYVYFNNTASPAAVINALQLLKLHNGVE